MMSSIPSTNVAYFSSSRAQVWESEEQGLEEIILSFVP